MVKQALAAMIDKIDYPNFKDSVEDRSLHAAYLQCLACNGRTTTSATRHGAGNPCKVGSNLEKHTVAQARLNTISGQPPKADIRRKGRHVCFVPKRKSLSCPVPKDLHVHLEFKIHLRRQ